MVTAETARLERDQRRRRRSDEGPDYAALARLARTDLLDLKSDFAYWNPEFSETQPDPDPTPVDLDTAGHGEPDHGRRPEHGAGPGRSDERREGGAGGEQG